MTGFSSYYIEANLVCTLVFAIMLLHNRYSIDRQEKQIKFDYALVAFILYFLSDCIWAAITDGLLPKTRASVVVVGFLQYLLMALISYSWLTYVMAYEYVPYRNDPNKRFLIALPFMLSNAALILHYLIAPHTLIDERLNTLPALNLYLIAVPYIYMAAILFYTIRQSSETENPAAKRKHLFVGFFPLMTIIGGLVEMLMMPEVPIFCFTCMLLMLVFYIQSILSLISIDPLTGLNNRGQLERYCAQKGNLYQTGRKTASIMLDIDCFKSINDTYGHAEGDRALVLVAGALKKALRACSMPSFLCRYGGDEFLFIVHPAALEEVEELLRDIRAKVALLKAVRPLTISAGYDELGDNGDTIKVCIQRADEKLYQEKKRKGTLRPKSITM